MILSENRHPLFRICSCMWYASPHETGLKPFSEASEKALKRKGPSLQGVIKRWGSIMWAIITFLYRQYCLARLAEMRRYRLGH